MPWGGQGGPQGKPKGPTRSPEGPKGKPKERGGGLGLKAISLPKMFFENNAYAQEDPGVLKTVKLALFNIFIKG